MTVLPDALGTLTPEQAVQAVVQADLYAWSERRRHLEMGPLHDEWCRLRMWAKRVAVCAPREHSKSETFTVNGTAWESIYKPGIWTYVFAATSDQARELLVRIKVAVENDAPWMLHRAPQDSVNDVVFSNGSRVTVAGAGKSVRGAHPDVIIGDDVLEEENCLTALQRKKMERWWFGTVGGMSHPGTYRVRRTTLAGEIQTRMWHHATRVFLVGTPFHEQDLLMSMRTNLMYEFRRYAAEFEDHELLPGTLAVEIT